MNFLYLHSTKLSVSVNIQYFRFWNFTKYGTSKLFNFGNFICAKVSNALHLYNFSSFHGRYQGVCTLTCIQIKTYSSNSIGNIFLSFATCCKMFSNEILSTQFEILSVPNDSFFMSVKIWKAITKFCDNIEFNQFNWIQIRNKIHANRSYHTTTILFNDVFPGRSISPGYVRSVGQ